MHSSIFLIALCLLTPMIAGADERILLYPGDTAKPGATEMNYFSDVWQTQVVTNVSRPSLTAFLPDRRKANGTGVVIAGTLSGYLRC